MARDGMTGRATEVANREIVSLTDVELKSCSSKASKWVCRVAVPRLTTGARRHILEKSSCKEQNCMYCSAEME